MNVNSALDENRKRPCATPSSRTYAVTHSRALKRTFYYNKFYGSCFAEDWYVLIKHITHNAEARPSNETFTREQTSEKGLKTRRSEAATIPVFRSQQSIAAARQRNSSIKVPFEAFSHSLALQSCLRPLPQLRPSKGVTPVHAHLKLCQHTVPSKIHVRAPKYKSCWKPASHMKTQTLTQFTGQKLAREPPLAENLNFRKNEALLSYQVPMRRIFVFWTWTSDLLK